MDTSAIMSSVESILKISDDENEQVVKNPEKKNIGAIDIIKTNKNSENVLQRKKVLDSETARSKSKKGKNKNNEGSNLKIKNNSKFTSKKENRKTLDDGAGITKLRSNTRNPTKTRKASKSKSDLLELRKSDIFRNSTKTPLNARPVVTEMLISLKEKIRQSKKEAKERRRKLGLKKESSSSSDSMEPFGVCVRNDLLNRAKRGNHSKHVEKQDHRDEVEVKPSLKEKIKGNKERGRKLGLKRKSSSSSDSMEPFGVCVRNELLKRPKLETDSKHVEKEHHDEVEVIPKEKINVISNILLQPAPNQNCQSLEPSDGCCCEYLLKVSSELLLQSINHVQGCKPHLINSDRYTPMMNSLRDFFKE